MLRLVIYIVLALGVIYWIRSMYRKPNSAEQPPRKLDSSGKHPFRAKTKPNEMWVQVYETASQSEAEAVKGRLTTENLECIIYQQGKKGIDGTEPKGIGVAVPKSLMSRAQKIVTQLLS